MAHRAVSRFFLAAGGQQKVVLAGVGQVGLFLGIKDFVQTLQALGDVGGVGPVGQVLGFDEQKDLAGRVADKDVAELAAQAFVAQIGVGVERDVGALQGQVVAARGFLDVAVELDDALGIAGREFVEEVACKELGAEVALFFGFDEGGVREDHRIFPGRAAQGRGAANNKAAGMCCLRPLECVPIIWAYRHVFGRLACHKTAGSQASLALSSSLT